MSADLAGRYYLDLAAAYVRGQLPDTADRPAEETFARGRAAGLRLHKFKRGDVLPRVRRVFGALRQFAPASLLDVGSGRGVFLWPLLTEFPDLRVHALDVRQDRVGELRAVARGGIDRLSAEVMDMTRATLPDRSVDGVTLLEVLEHMPTPAEAVRHAVRIARRFVIVTVPSKPDDNPEHIHLFDRASLTGLFARAGVPRVSIDYLHNHILAVATVGAPS